MLRSSIDNLVSSLLVDVNSVTVEIQDIVCTSRSPKDLVATRIRGVRF